MKKILTVFRTILLFTLILQTHSKEVYQFISPQPGSSFNTMESTIIIREGNFIDRSTIDADAVQVTGTKSGTIEGELILSSDNKTLIFKPDSPFLPDETINVNLLGIIKSDEGKSLPGYSFSFVVAPFEKTPNPYEYIDDIRPDFGTESRAKMKSNDHKTTGAFPTINVEMYDEDALGEGYIFLAVAADVEGVGYYLMMLNNDGTPYWSRELPEDYAYDFKIQPNGQVTYAQFLEHHSYTGGGNVVHKVLDHVTLEEIDQVQMGNGYIAEAHDFQILPNGHYLLFGYYLTEVDLSDLVDGGYPNALVSGGIVQELDADKNVVFQWRTWDHYDFETYEWGRRSNQPIVSEFHLNTINLDADNNIIIATPRWVKKINRQTGERIWSLGDFDNDFSFINCDEGYVGGHMIHRIYDNHFLIYDNGNRQGTSSSQAHELIIDEENKTCELFWSYVPDSLISGWHRGNAQRLPNGNTVIGWGGSSGKYSPTFTEVDENGNKLMEVFFDPYDVESYRAFRFPFTGGAPIAEVIETEVANGNTYDFIDEDTGDTGISIKVNNREGQGYNELIVTKYNFAPLEPVFVNKAPQVLPRRFVLSQFGITGINADVFFDVDIWGITDPENTIVYQREFENSGLFVPLPTTYNSITRKVKVTTSKFGEFILGTDDLESLTFKPMPVYPENEGTVNQELELILEWNPVGYVNSYSLQVAKDQAFTNLIVDETNLVNAVYSINILEDETTYYWRVKSVNDAGESEWSSTHTFSSVPPFITISYPTVNTELQIGLNYFIEWVDNIDEDVIINLLKGESFIEVIDTTKSDRAYEWEIETNLVLGTDYQLQFVSVNNSELVSLSGAFSLIDTVTSIEDYSNTVPHDYELSQNYPNPFNPTTIIQFAIPKSENVSLKVYDVIGNEIALLIDGFMQAGSYTVKFDAGKLSSGIYFYTLNSGEKTISKKMILIK